MQKDFSRNIFSIFFLFIFFIKMLISAAPLLIDHMDSKAVNAVIMQLEIEDSPDKSAGKIKETLVKDYFDKQHEFCFSNPILHLSATSTNEGDDKHVQTYYPSVPTPPPSA